MHFKVAICDDEIEWIRIIKERLNTFYFETDISFEISEFSNPTDLLASYVGPGTYNILFLDMELPFNGEMQTGFDLAKKIRSLPDNELRIIFFSNYPQYMNLGYDVHASHYLEKNVPIQKFSNVLSDVITSMTKDNSMIKI